MKIYNYGSDYAYQRKMEIKTEEPSAESPKNEINIVPVINEENTIQNGGGVDLESTTGEELQRAEEIPTAIEETEKETPKRKKERTPKEEGEEAV